ncbi:uncharacterized protein METZ01_LOCUS141748, partial [marine metagenome]
MNFSLFSVLNEIPVSSPPLHLEGLKGSSKALVLKETHRMLGKTLIVVCDSYENGEMLLKDLGFYMGMEGLYFFPPWDVMPYDLFSPHRSLVSQRLQCLHHLQKEKCRVLVTTPHGLMQRLIPKAHFKKNILRIKKGEQVNPEKVRNQLQETGYLGVDMVEDQGDFSFHGPTLDVFPIQSEKPVRLEFSGQSEEELLHLKPFDVQSQRSGTTELEELTLLPCSEIIFNEETLSQAQRKLHQFRGEFKGPMLRHLGKKLHSAERFPGLEALCPLFYPQMETLFDYFPEPRVLVVDEDKRVRGRAKHFHQEIFMEYEHSVQQKRMTLPMEES